MFLAAVVQIQATSNQVKNLATTEALIRTAASRGARLIATPENTNFLGPHDRKVNEAETLSGETCTLFSNLARELDVHLLLGSFNEKSNEAARCYNTSVLFANDGQILASYRKVHLFDVDVEDGVRFKESETTVPGEELCAVPTPLATLGLTICYDLRFPGVYQSLCDQGAQVLTVPSAFTLMTGKDHWYPLLRTRAIENQAYVLAPAQWGEHDDNGLRHSYGHSLIIDPWGQVIASVPTGEGVAIAEIDLDRVRRVRESMPVCEHRRF